jgi:hypothetical protein
MHPCLECDSNPRSQRSSEAKTVHALDCAATVIFWSMMTYRVYSTVKMEEKYPSETLVLFFRLSKSAPIQRSLMIVAVDCM